MHRKTWLLLLVLLPLAVSSTGCLAFGQAFDLASVVITLTAAGSARLGLSILDRRESIRTGGKEPFFAGLQRGGFGNPFDVIVKDKKPLAGVMAEVTAAGLKAQGFDVNPINVEINTSEEAAVQKFKDSSAEKILLISIDKWQSDTLTNVGMHYNVTAQVLSPEGSLLAKHTVTGAENGMDNLKGSVMNPMGHAKRVVPAAFKEHIEKLINNEAISKALS
ncbi:MAG: hypothetical protein GY754_19000 [bacterium]|nr:hypothetical protein [bacterium]